MKKNTNTKAFLALTLFFGVVLSLHFFCGTITVNAEVPEKSEEAQDETEEKKKEAEEKEEKIDDYREKLEKIQKQKNELAQKKYVVSSDINQISQNISLIEGDIDSTQVELEIFKEEIKSKEQEVERKKFQISDILMGINELDAEVFLISLNGNSGFEEYFSAVDSLEQLEEKLLVAIEEVRRQKSELEGKRKSQQEVYDRQVGQKNLLAQEKNKKHWILNQTQQEIVEVEATISQIQSKITELKSDISVLLGKSYDTDQIKDAIKFASKQTGVRKGFLFGMLSVESGLATNVGNCNYKESRMNDTRKKYFKEICDELDYDYKKQKVSCPPASYTGTGGAMGAAQFMSDTWMGYKARISAATGHRPPDPWNLVDGVMAMALKLQNDGATKDGKTSITSPCNGKKIDVKRETYASMRYLGWSCFALTTYAPKIQSLAGGYDKL